MSPMKKPQRTRHPNNPPWPKLLRQPRIPGQRRTPMGTSVERAIERWILAEQRRYPGISRAFVIANALAYVAGVEIKSYK
jgi:hypothetical protein